MNLILLKENDFVDKNRVELHDERLEYVRKVHRAKKGDKLKTGLINNLIGSGEIIELDEKKVVFEVILDKQPPEPIPVNLVLAMPRPKVLRRIIQSVTILGIKKFFIINAFRVEKSYWQTPFLKEESINEQIKSGLSQAVDTVEPEIVIKKYFKPFVEDELDIIAENTNRIVAHPGNYNGKKNKYEKSTVIIGPEGGFIDYEIGKLMEYGFKPAGFGERILKVETAIPYIISKFTGVF